MILYGIYMLSHNGVVDLHRLQEMPELFDGVTKAGFDRTHRNAWGGTCRVQNLGDRRIRIESNRFELTDGLMILSLLKMALLFEEWRPDYGENDE